MYMMISKHYHKHFYRTGDTALHYAAIGGHSDPILSLVNKGAEVNGINNDKRTALHIAVLNRRFEVVASLMKVGADVNIPDSSGDTPFQLSVIQVRETHS